MTKSLMKVLGLVVFMVSGLAYADQPANPQTSIAPSQAEFYLGSLVTTGTLGDLQLNSAEGELLIGTRVLVDISRSVNNLNLLVIRITPSAEQFDLYPVPTNMLQFSTLTASESGVVVEGVRYNVTETEEQIVTVKLKIDLLDAQGSPLKEALVSEEVGEVVQRQPKQ